MTRQARRGAARAAAASALLLIAACSPPKEQEAAPAAGGSTAAPSPAASAAPAAAAGGGAAGATAYDPAKDPLVNPPGAFEKAPADPAQIASDETLVRYLDGNPNSLMPLFASSLIEFNINDLTTVGPYTFDAKMQWITDPAVTEKLEESPDHLAWTTTMKPGLKWQDGEPFTAEDICYSYREIMDERVPCPAVRSGTDQIAKCEVVDPRTFRITHKEALPTNKWNVTFPLIPKHVYEKGKKDNPDLKSGEYYVNANRLPVGNGPYKIVNWVENDRIELERWEDYFGPKPHFKRMIFKIIPDQNIQMLSFSKGDIDEFRMSPVQFSTQSGPESDFAKAGYKAKAPVWDYVYMGWNMDGTNPFFSDVRVRRAMTLAADVKRMVRDVSFNLNTQCPGIFHPEAVWYNPEIKLLPYDLEAASKLLDEAGWKVDEAQGGYRYKTIDGKPVQFKFTLNVAQGRPENRDAAVIFQEDLKSIGVAMDIQILEFATQIERCRKHDFQAYLAAWGTGTDPDTQWNLWRSDQWVKDGSFGRNYVKYVNPRVDELFDKARHEFDPGKRRAYYQEISKTIYEEQPYTWLWNRATLWGVAKRMHGIEMGPRGLFNTTPSVLAWWVSPKDQKYPAAKP